MRVTVNVCRARVVCRERMTSYRDGPIDCGA